MRTASAGCGVLRQNTKRRSWLAPPLITLLFPDGLQLPITCGRRPHGRRRVTGCHRRVAGCRAIARWHATGCHAIERRHVRIHVLRWDALHWNGKGRWKVFRSRRRAIPGRGLRRHRPCGRLRRDIVRHRHSQSDVHPSRGYIPSRPRGPCRGRCRCRNSLIRNSPWARTGRARIRSSHRHRQAEHRC